MHFSKAIKAHLLQSVKIYDYMEYVKGCHDIISTLIRAQLFKANDVVS